MKRKIIFISIGILQIVTLINMSPFYYKLAHKFNSMDLNDSLFWSFHLLHSLLFLVIVVSIFLYFSQTRAALRLYYFEFFLRLFLFTTTFGFVLKLNILFKDTALYNTLIISVIILEVFRLLASIILDIKWSKG